MEFIAKFKGNPPAAQDQPILFSDCETNASTADAPTALNTATNQPWLHAAFVPASTVRVSVNQDGMNAGTYTGEVSVTIPAAETCEPGKVFAIAVTLTVQKGKVKFQ